MENDGAVQEAEEIQRLDRMIDNMEIAEDTANVEAYSSHNSKPRRANLTDTVVRPSACCGRNYVAVTSIYIV